MNDKKMRGKPDLGKLKATDKDIDTFLAGADDSGEKSTSIVKKKEVKVQKIFRLDWEVVQALRAKSMDLSTPGNHVSETDIVDKALREYLKS